MRAVSSLVAGLSAARIAEMLDGLSDAEGYDIVVKPLRYRTRPHLAAWTDFEARRITLQLPEPFLPFGEIVNYAARRKPGKGMKFLWFSEGVTFQNPEAVLRFLYLHEWMHWYLRERLGRKAFAETACDRFALRNYQRRTVGTAEADDALRRATDSSTSPAARHT